MTTVADLIDRLRAFPPDALAVAYSKGEGDAGVMVLDRERPMDVLGHVNIVAPDAR